MLRLPCPHCGVRPVTEFRYGEMPSVPVTITDPLARDLDRAYMRDNAAGVVTERWFHEAGCRRWLTITRDTTTDQVLPPESGLGAVSVDHKQRRDR